MSKKGRFRYSVKQEHKNKVVFARKSGEVVLRTASPAKLAALIKENPFYAQYIEVINESSSGE